MIKQNDYYNINKRTQAILDTIKTEDSLTEMDPHEWLEYQKGNVRQNEKKNKLKEMLMIISIPAAFVVGILIGGLIKWIV